MLFLLSVLSSSGKEDHLNLLYSYFAVVLFFFFLLEVHVALERKEDEE
jgi:hypothetical protein